MSFIVHEHYGVGPRIEEETHWLNDVKTIIPGRKANFPFHLVPCCSDNQIINCQFSKQFVPDCPSKDSYEKPLFANLENRFPQTCVISYFLSKYTVLLVSREFMLMSDFPDHNLYKYLLSFFKEKNIHSRQNNEKVVEEARE